MLLGRTLRVITLGWPSYTNSSERIIQSGFSNPVNNSRRVVEREKYPLPFNCRRSTTNSRYVAMNSNARVDFRHLLIGKNTLSSTVRLILEPIADGKHNIQLTYKGSNRAHIRIIIGTSRSGAPDENSEFRCGSSDLEHRGSAEKISHFVYLLGDLSTQGPRQVRSFRIGFETAANGVTIIAHPLSSPRKAAKYVAHRIRRDVLSVRYTPSSRPCLS